MKWGKIITYHSLEGVSLCGAHPYAICVYPVALLGEPDLAWTRVMPFFRVNWQLPPLEGRAWGARAKLCLRWCFYLCPVSALVGAFAITVKKPQIAQAQSLVKAFKKAQFCNFIEAVVADVIPRVYGRAVAEIIHNFTFLAYFYHCQSLFCWQLAVIFEACSGPAAYFH